MAGPGPVCDANLGAPARSVGNPRRRVTRPCRPYPDRPDRTGPPPMDSGNMATPRTRSSPESPRGNGPQETSAFPIENELLRTIPAGDFYLRQDAISASPNRIDPGSHNPCRGFLRSPGVARAQRRLPQVNVPQQRPNTEGVVYEGLDVAHSSGVVALDTRTRSSARPGPARPIGDGRR